MNLVRVCDDECKGCAICVSCVPRDVSPCLANSMPRATNMSVSSRIPPVLPVDSVFLSCPEPSALTVCRIKEES